MPSPHAVDIVDETFIVADPATVAAVVADPASWRRWWPDLRPEVTRDRGVKGMQWAVRGAVVGSMEIWLEPYGDGVIVHYFLRADPPDGSRTGLPRGAARLAGRRTVAWKRHVHALKDRLEAGREPGAPRVVAAEVAAVKEPAKPAESP